MEAQELIQKLSAINQNWDEEINHLMADDLLLEYINNPEVAKAFKSIKKWYA